MIMRVSKLDVNPKQRTNLAAIAARCILLHVYSKRDPLGREMKVKDAQQLKREYIFGLDGGGSDLTSA
jgi:hypothetical protein